jgi:colanic acid/amylovoran biosynthesis glycosyltransferase
MTNRRVLLMLGVLGRPSEVFLYRQATGLQEYVCHVAATQYRNPKTYPYPRVHLLDADWPITRLALRIGYAIRLRTRPTREGVRSWRLGKLARRLDVDLIHVHFLWNAPQAFEAVNRTGVPLLVTVHGTDINTALVDGQYCKLVEPVFERATRLLAVSDFIARRLEEVGCPADKIARLYLGAPLPNAVSAPGSDRHIQIACVAAFRAVKGHRFLIDAVAQAVTENNRLRLVLVGDGPERENIEKLVKSKGLSQIVTFTGTLCPKGVNQVLQHSHI